MKLRIKEIRVARGLTQEELANKIQFSRSYLAQLESGARELTTKKLAAIAAALEVDPKEIVDFNAPDQRQEALIIEAFRSLSPDQRKSWLDLAKVTLGSKSEER